MVTVELPHWGDHKYRIGAQPVGGRKGTCVQRSLQIPPGTADLSLAETYVAPVIFHGYCHPVSVLMSWQGRAYRAWLVASWVSRTGSSQALTVEATQPRPVPTSRAPSRAIGRKESSMASCTAMGGTKTFSKRISASLRSRHCERMRKCRPATLIAVPGSFTAGDSAREAISVIRSDRNADHP